MEYRFFMNNLWKRIFFAALLCIGIYIMLSVDSPGKDSIVSKPEKESMQRTELTFWYSDEKFEAYLSEAAVEYEKDNNVKINMEFVPSSEYLQKVAMSSVTKEAVSPDLYIVRDEFLENAFALGITSENTSEQFREGNFARTALDAVSYHGKLIAYPLSIHVPCFIYRSDLIEEPYSLEQIMNYDISPFYESGMEKNIDFNTGNFLTEYAFIGKYVNVGGNLGDEQELIQIDENMLSQSIGFFQNIITGTGISPNALEEAMIAGFAEGKNMSLILSSDYIALFNDYMRDRNITFNIISIPKLSDFLESSTGSCTDAVVVNGMSRNQKQAGDFAEFLTCVYAEHIYEKTNLLPACYNSGISLENFDKLYDIYKNSSIFPKLLKTEDFSLNVKVLFEKAINGQDCTAISNEFTNSLKNRIVQ